MLYNKAMNKTFVNKRPEKATFIVYDNGEVLEDPTFVDYYKLNRFDEILANKLLGQFDSDGKYSFSDELKQIFVDLNKLLTEVKRGEIICESELNSITLHFVAKFWQDEDCGYANLYIVEKMDESSLVSFIAQYSAPFDISFIPKVKTVFNILDTLPNYNDDENAKKIEEILANLERKRAEREFVVEIQSELYVNEMMDLLEYGGPISKRILDQFRVIFQQASTRENKARIFTDLRMQLDRLIIAAGGFKALEKEIPNLTKVMKNFVQPIKEFDTISRKLDIIQEKTSPAKASSSKGGKSKAAKPLKPKTISPYGKSKSGGGKKNKGGKATIDVSKLKLSEPKKAPKEEPEKEEEKEINKDMADMFDMLGESKCLARETMYGGLDEFETNVGDLDTDSDKVGPKSEKGEENALDSIVK